MSRLSVSSIFALVVFLGITLAPAASASTASEIGTLPTLDALNRSETPLSNAGRWSTLAWNTASPNPTGIDTTSGWRPSQSFPAVSGAYWNPRTFEDGGAGDAAALTLQASPEVEERYVAIWLNMPSPGSAKSGYQLKWALNPNLSTYTVVLSKWSSGTQTVLKSNESVSIPSGTTMAISDTGGTVAAWQTVGGTLTSILSAEDSSFGTGYAGIEGAGNISRSQNFRAGKLFGESITGVSVLDNLSRDEIPLKSASWSKLNWASEIGGVWNSGGYHGFGANSEFAGAYWNPTTFTDTGQGVLVGATVGNGSEEEGEYMALWLNMPKPNQERSGYEARFTGTNGSPNSYIVQLAEWNSGSRAVLASTSSFSLPEETTMALTEVSGSLAVWTGTSSFSPVLWANDSTYSSGYAGLEVFGIGGTEFNFRAGTP